MPPPHRPKSCPKTRPETSAVLPRNPKSFVTNAWFSGHVSGRPLCPTCTFGCVVHKRPPCPPKPPLANVPKALPSARASNWRLPMVACLANVPRTRGQKRPETTHFVTKPTSFCSISPRNTLLFGGISCAFSIKNNACFKTVVLAALHKQRQRPRGVRSADPHRSGHRDSAGSKTA